MQFNDFEPEEHYFEDGIDVEDYKYQTGNEYCTKYSLQEKKAEKFKVFKKNYAIEFCKENGIKAIALLLHEWVHS